MPPPWPETINAIEKAIVEWRAMPQHSNSASVGAHMIGNALSKAGLVEFGPKERARVVDNLVVTVSLDTSQFAADVERLARALREALSENSK
jgi:hypothetical protein